MSGTTGPWLPERLQTWTGSPDCWHRPRWALGLGPDSTPSAESTVLTLVLGKWSSPIQVSLLLPTCPLLVLVSALCHCTTFCFLLDIGDGEQFREVTGARGTLCTNADLLGVKSEWIGSETGLRAASIRIAFSLISCSFLMWGLKPRSGTYLFRGTILGI